jgi:hypothetical protein
MSSEVRRGPKSPFKLAFIEAGANPGVKVLILKPHAEIFEHTAVIDTARLREKRP